MSTLRTRHRPLIVVLTVILAELAFASCGTAMSLQSSWRTTFMVVAAERATAPRSVERRQASRGQGATYYVDPTGGSDKADGQSPETAWKTLAQVSGSTLDPGDAVLLRRGGAWLEQLTIPSSGSGASPIRIGAYGTGEKPLIDAEGKRGFCIRAEGKNHITIENLRCTRWLNTGISIVAGEGWVVRQTELFTGGNDSPPDYAIRVSAGRRGAVLNGVTIVNNRIGTINTKPSEDIGAVGILLQGVTASLIAGNAVNTGNTAGIRLALNSGSPDNDRVTIEKNVLEGCHANIIVHNTDFAVVRHNTIVDGEGLGIGIAYDSDHAVVEQNTIHNLQKRTARLWNGIDVNHGSDHGVIRSNRVSAVHMNAVVIAGGSDWKIEHNLLDVTGNTVLPLALKLFHGVTWVSNFNTFWSGRPVCAGNLLSNPSFEEFSGTPDDGQRDVFDGWGQAGDPGHGGEAVTQAETEVGYVPHGRHVARLRLRTRALPVLTADVHLQAKMVYALSFFARSDGPTGMLAVSRPPGVFLQQDGTWRRAPSPTPALTIGAKKNWTAHTLKFSSLNETRYTFTVEARGRAGSLYVDGFELQEKGPAVAEHESTEGLLGGLAYDLPDWRMKTRQDANSTFGEPIGTARSPSLTVKSGGSCRHGQAAI